MMTLDVGLDGVGWSWMELDDVGWSWMMLEGVGWVGCFPLNLSQRLGYQLVNVSTCQPINLSTYQPISHSARQPK